MKKTILTFALVAVAFGSGWATRAYSFEPHPEIRAAMGSLQAAITHPRKADRDFDGHRTKAVELARSAVHECEAALRADRH